jgi:hypothetical protein
MKVKEDALFYTNFMDPLTDDQPQGSWSIQADSSKTHVAFFILDNS